MQINTHLISEFHRAFNNSLIIDNASINTYLAYLLKTNNFKMLSKIIFD